MLLVLLAQKMIVVLQKIHNIDISNFKVEFLVSRAVLDDFLFYQIWRFSLNMRKY